MNNYRIVCDSRYMTTKNMKELTPEEITANWEKFRALCKRLGDRTGPIDKMLDQVEERMSIAPASSRVEHHCCFPGGLISHTLRVVTNALIVAKNFFPDEGVSKESIVMVGLFHDLGKISFDDDVYTPQDSDWHRKQGMLYKINENVQPMEHSMRSIFMLQKFGIELSEDEFVAVMCHDGPIVEQNRKNFMKEPVLAVILHVADLLATHQEKLEEKE